MTNYEIPIPIITDLKLENGAIGVAKQVKIGNVIFIYLNITLSTQLPQWIGIVSGLTRYNVQVFYKNMDGVTIQINPEGGYIQTAQATNTNVRIAASLFYVI